MPDITKVCTLSGKPFTITEAEQQFLENISPVFNGKKYLIPLPTLCPEERRRRRLSWRNDRNLYRRKCNLTGKDVVSIYNSGVPMSIYSIDAWWGDDWDAKSYGRDFDFTRPFFDQFKELQNQVPHVALWNWKSENSEYNHSAYGNKNCYMNFATDNCEDCYYNYLSDRLLNSSDNTMLLRSELCYECVDSEDLYACRFCQDCRNGSFLDFCVDCIGCESCIGCVNLQQKKYCAFNEQLTKEEWESKYKDLDLSHSKRKELQDRFQAFLALQPRPAYKIFNSENCQGNYIRNSRNVHNSFDVWKGEDIWHSTYIMEENKNVMDSHAVLQTNNVYEVMAGQNLNESAFIIWINNGPHNSYYCDLCVNNSHNCFGCVGLKKAEYCILNKQYTKEEYEILVPKIIEHMMEMKEWGEFFPSKNSFFGYNETIASDFFPLSKGEATSMGFRWYDTEKKFPTDAVKVEVSDSITETDEDICQKILICEESGKPYRIIPQEFELYKKLQVAVPRLCFDRRHVVRLRRKNPWFSWDRKCQKCNKEIVTSYAPERKEIVYCEECYTSSVY